jgi:V/A-type H+-transporting ATPase subunit I
MEKVVNRLYELNVYHVKEHKKTEELDIGRPMEKSEKLAEILVKLRAIISQLGIKEEAIELKKAPEALTAKDYYELGRRSRHLYVEITKYLNKIKGIDEQTEVLKEKIKTLKFLWRIKLNLDIFAESKTLNHFVGFGKKLFNLRAELEEAVTRFEMTELVGKRDWLITVFYEKQNEEKIREVLSRNNVTEVDMTPLEGLKGKPMAHVKKLQEKLTNLEKEKNALQRKLQNLRRKNEEFLLRNEMMLTQESKKAELPLKFASTEKSFMATGWVPTGRLQKVKKELNKVAHEKIYIQVDKPGPKDVVPVKLKNPKLIKPFEFFMELYALPKYKEIDPTFLLFITFPLFFGFMLGDVGYGIITLGLWLFLKKKFPSIKALLNIMIFASIITILFGFAFGEYLGFEHVSEEKGEWLCHNANICFHEHEIVEHGKSHVVYTFPRLMARVEGKINVAGFDILAVLVIGAIVGLIHINLSILIGFYNELKAHGFKAAFFEKISWFVFEAGIVLLILTYANILPISKWVGLLVLLLSVIMIYGGEGVQGLVELPAIFTNILSYMRLGAVGLASVGLAVVINEELVMPFFAKGGFFILAGILIMVIGHTINIGLGIIGPFLHSIRLHYVEFFTRFYKGGGKEYSPFGYKV